MSYRVGRIEVMTEHEAAQQSVEALRRLSNAAKASAAALRKFSDAWKPDAS